MARIYSNGPQKDYVINPFNKLVAGASRLYLAAPYFTHADPILDAVKKGKSVQLLVGLNSATSPDALKKVHEVPSLAVRYLTSRFHAKIYIFDDAALLGSSNLTDGGLYSNREATICLDQPEDHETVEEIRGLFLELWEAGQVLTKEKLDKFANAYKATRRQGPDPDNEIEKAVGKAEPPNINVASHEQSRERIFLEGLRQEVYEQYRPAFNEVTAILEEHGFRRPELADLGAANETNRFLNWVRLTYVIGDEAWQSAPLRSPEERRAEIIRFGTDWTQTDSNKVPEDYAAWLGNVRRIFGTPDALKAASKEDITQGLMSIHAFIEQLRFVKGGEKNLPPEFWKRNNEDAEHVKETLSYLLHGQGDFIQRLHDILYEPSMKLGLFGRFCALELYGTVKPEECPPMNGRMAKALRYLGFDVKGA
tara:strand:- start:48684 stop:49952 length:1269 start_codon:yes stop_codon:yes gene_type:complete